MARRRTLLSSASEWTPDPKDPDGGAKRALISYLIETDANFVKPITIATLQRRVRALRKYSRGQFQQLVVGPLRRERHVFIGTSSRGLFLVQSPQDAFETMAFYTDRIRAERWHLRNLKILAKRYRLFQSFVPEKSRLETAAFIFFDESGVPSLNDPNPFIVTAVSVDAAELKVVRQRMDTIRQVMKLGAEEFKSTGLSKKAYTRVLQELSLVEYEWAAVVFHKSGLKGPGFRHSTSFYKYAYQSLAGILLDHVSHADLVFDQYSSSNQSAFAKSFFGYLREQNAGYPAERIKSIDMLDSKGELLLQLADLIAGVVKNREKGKFDLTPMIEEKCLALEQFPPQL